MFSLGLYIIIIIIIIIDRNSSSFIIISRSHTAYTTVPTLIFVLANKGCQVKWHFVIQSMCTYYTFGVGGGA